MRKLVLLVQLLVLAIATQSYSQERIQVSSSDEIPDGVPYRESVQADGSVVYHYSAKAKSAVVNNAAMGTSKFLGSAVFNNRNNPFFVLLESAKQDNISKLLDLELTKEQQEGLKDISRRYQTEKKSASDTERHVLIGRYVDEIRDLLLQEQLANIGKMAGMGNLFKLILCGKASEFLELTPEQLAKIERECQSANEEIRDALEKVRKLTDDNRKRVRKVLDTLSKEQLAKLNRLTGTKDEDYFSKSSLESLFLKTLVEEKKD